MQHCNNVYLIGFPGCGKSTLGKKIATKLSYNFIDLDTLIEQKFSCSINDFFDLYGENEFRKQETICLKNTDILTNSIIATGGGTPCFNNNMEWINSHGISIYLQMPAKMLFHRLQQNSEKRPILMQQQDILMYIEKTLPQREKYYKQAKITISAAKCDINQLILQLKQ